MFITVVVFVFLYISYNKYGKIDVTLKYEFSQMNQ